MATVLCASPFSCCLSAAARQGKNVVRAHLDGRASAELRKAASHVFRASKLLARYSQSDLTIPHWFEADGRAWLDTQKGANGTWNRYPAS